MLPGLAPSPALLTPDPNTLLLIHANSNFADSSSPKKTVTSLGTAAIDTSVKKFGAGSIKFNNDGGVTAAPESTFDFGTGPFTIEFWVYFPSVSGTDTLLAKAPNGSFTPFVLNRATNSLRLWVTSSGSSWTIINNASVGTVTSGTWYHVALVRDISTGYVVFYLDGVIKAYQSTTSSLLNTSSPIAFGSYPDAQSPADCYMDEIRVSDIARYTAAFTPPTKPFLR